MASKLHRNCAVVFLQNISQSIDEIILIDLEYRSPRRSFLNFFPQPVYIFYQIDGLHYNVVSLLVSFDGCIKSTTFKTNHVVISGGEKPQRKEKARA